MRQSVRHTFSIGGMHCASCTMLIDETLEDLPGIHRAQTTLRTALTIVHADPAVTTELIIAGVEEAGYSATVERSC